MIQYQNPNGKFKMEGKILIINFQDDKAFLLEDKVLFLEQLNLPDNTPFKSPTSWKIRVIRYIPSEKKIFVEILEYNKGKQPFPRHQILLDRELKAVSNITFKSINTYGLLITRGIDPKIQNYIPKIENEPGVEEINKFTKPPATIMPATTIINETFLIPIKKVNFKSGGVSFEKWVPRLKREFEFNVPNEIILEEFDAVKNYFGNVLQTKKIQFNSDIHLTAGEVVSIVTTSPEISRIDQSLIDDVRVEYTKAVIKKKLQPNIDKSLFTMDELFNTLSEETIMGNVFYKREDQLIEDLMKITNTKHYYHLRFLSSKHLHSVMKLRFVLKPFSFLFLIEGKMNYHIIWETLDTSEATYLWLQNKDIKKLKLELVKIEEIIKSIKVQGKIKYINEADSNFMRIYHDYYDQQNGFIKWKGELEKLIT